jgi:NTP pyrophosphatase (non-canonical NTP hydrolase)
MTFQEYQAQAKRTAGEPPYTDMDLAVAGLGIAGEAGEVADYLKKVLSHGHPLDRAKLIHELGDVQWYIAQICTLLGIDLEQVPWANLEKLKTRYPDGFDPNRSQNRPNER